MLSTQWILQRIKLSPKKIALIDIDTNIHWTYEQLFDHIAKWIYVLREKNVKKGDRICIISENSTHLFPIIFACGLLGLIYVPLNYRLSKKELTDLTIDSDCTVLIYSETYKNINLPLATNKCLSMNEIANVKEISTIDNLPKFSSKKPWLIIYTGGTTGKPKGVVISHEAVATNALNTIATWSIGEDDVTVNYMPLFHTGGINALSIPILMAGGTVVIGNHFDVVEALSMTQKYEATISLFVPTMYQQIIQTTYFKTERFPSMRVFLSGGAPCPSQVYDAFKRKGLHFKEGYGLTEAGPNNFFICPEKAMKKVGSVGKSMLFNKVKVINDNGILCQPNEVGELYLKGKHLFTNYWGNEEETAKVLLGNWLKTGDLAKYDEEGDYYIVGRKKDMIISGGENIYPEEIERCLLYHHQVIEAAVVGIPDDKWGEKVVAFIVSKGSQSIDENILREHCEKFLGGYKIPKYFYHLRKLPKTDVGKIDKNKLIDLILK